ncbi:MAG: hypothetical protein HY047_20415 [Acidobacteria bacterium]|nr:hypothetical protein [Acidobacteriota bacterium]
MIRRLSILGCLLAALASVGIDGQTRATVGLRSIRIRETAGIRRSAYPVNARVPIRKGTLHDASHARLLVNNAEAPAQFSVDAIWPDGSVQSLAVDFNISVGPGDETMAQLEYGDEVKAETVTRGLTVTETPDAIQVGNVRFGRTLAPLLLSVKYRLEDIGQGLNGFALLDSTGASHDARDVESLKVEVLKRGPLYVVLKYSGRVAVGGDARVPFTLTAEMPNSKTWVKVTTTIDDPGKRVRELSFHTPLAFSAFPRTWDFGTGSWSYGLLRSASEITTLTQIANPPKSSSVPSWQIRTGAKGQEQVVERSSGLRPAMAEGWGHIQDAKEAVAFAIGAFGAQAGTYAMTLDGDGHASYRVAPARPQTRVSLTVYQHFVATPVPVGAVTSPIAMLHPLIATVAVQ